MVAALRSVFYTIAVAFLAPHLAGFKIGDAGPVKHIHFIINRLLNAIGVIEILQLEPVFLPIGKKTLVFQVAIGPVLAPPSLPQAFGIGEVDGVPVFYLKFLGMG